MDETKSMRLELKSTKSRRKIANAYEGDQFTIPLSSRITFCDYCTGWIRGEYGGCH